MKASVFRSSGQRQRAANGCGSGTGAPAWHLGGRGMAGTGRSSVYRDRPQDFCCGGSAWMTECRPRWVRDNHPRAGEENTVADKISIASQRILGIGTVLLAAVWSLSFIVAVNGQSSPGSLP